MAYERMTDSHFRWFKAFSAVRDFIKPPRRLVAAVGLGPGDVVLEIGCGRGGFTVAAARAVGPRGRVFAVDAHPLAVRSTRALVSRARLTNVEVVEGEFPTSASFPGLAADAVLLFDVFHCFGERAGVLAEIAGLLKPGGVLAITNPDQHVSDVEIAAAVAAAGRFGPAGQTKRFAKFTLLP